MDLYITGSKIRLGPLGTDRGGLTLPMALQVIGP